MSTEPDLDATIAALERAVGAGDGPTIARHLAAIEDRLRTMNPLVRGLTYAHVKSVLGRPDEAVAVVEDLLELMPDHGVVYYQLGCYRRAAEDRDGALEAFTRATELDGALVDAWLQRGMLLDSRGEPEGAIEAYRHVILRSPAEVDGWRNMGNSLAALGHFDEALEAYRTAAGLRGEEDPTLAVLISSVHQAKGDVAQANAVLPEGVVTELGRVEEVRVEGGERVMVCRFHAPIAKVDAHREAARALLEGAAPVVAGLGAEAFPVAHGGALLVEQDGGVVVCDVDPSRPGLPHRFFDATGVVTRLTPL